jgi:hypothetical protein
MPFKNLKDRKKYQRKWYLKNKKENYQKWLEEKRISCREYYRKNKKRENKRSRLYKLKNKEKIKITANIYYKNRRKKDMAWRLLVNVRTRINHALKGKYKKSKKTRDILGCTVEELKKYIESKFKLGMSWEKRHLIHIDHIKPCSSFDLTKASEQRECFHYTNLQPLWASENLAKGSKIS